VKSKDVQDILKISNCTDRGSILNDFIKSRPQELCLMCGKCCRVSTTSKTYMELLELVEQGDEGAINFLGIFEPYSSIEEARKVSPETVDNILKYVGYTPAHGEKITFYRCKHILDNNLCGIYEKRPELCDRFPSTCWAVIPPGCGFEGWLFKKIEETKQKIRKQKEIIFELEIYLKELNDPEKIEKVQEAIKKANETIGFFAQYGAKDW